VGAPTERVYGMHDSCKKPWHVYMLVRGRAGMFLSLAEHSFRLGHNQRVYAAGDHVGL
jgi:hypothetical protein